jgi:uncharacterized protein YuzE
MTATRNRTAGHNGTSNAATDSGARVEVTPHATLRYRPAVDALYIRYAEGEHCFTAEVGDEVYLDYSKDGRVLGIEVLGASAGIELDALPFAGEVAQALHALGLPIIATEPAPAT